jgi:hypothetical protein
MYTFCYVYSSSLIVPTHASYKNSCFANGRTSRSQIVNAIIGATFQKLEGRALPEKLHVVSFEIHAKTYAKF